MISLIYFFTEEIIIVVILYSFQILEAILNVMFMTHLLNAFGSPDRGESLTPFIPAMVLLFFWQITSSIIKSHYSFYYVRTMPITV